MFTGLGEVNIVCTDLERSLHFYRDVMGFNVVEEDDGAIRLRFDKLNFLLLPFAKTAGTSPPYMSVPTFSMDLITDNIARCVAHLQAHHVRFVEPYEEGKLSYFIYDPDGLVWEIIDSSF